MGWLSKEENSRDFLMAVFLLVDFMLINGLFKFFTSFMNHPAGYYTWFQAWIIIPLGCLIVPILLVSLIIFQIRIVREDYLKKIIRKLDTP